MMPLKLKCSYIICSTPRSGSTLLCDLLASTEIAGRPESYFMNGYYQDWASYFNVPADHWSGENEFDQTYMDSVMLNGTGDTLTFGLRVQWESLDDLSRRLEAFCPNLHTTKDRFSAAFNTQYYIHISREDKVAQAVSLLRAEQSGLWHKNSDGTERERLKQGQVPVYNYKALSKLVAELKLYDAAWLQWFDEHQIQPISVAYEMLAATPQTVLEKVLIALGLDPEVAQTVKPKTAKLSNTENTHWIERFRTQRSGI